MKIFFKMQRFYGRRSKIIYSMSKFEWKFWNEDFFYTFSESNLIHQVQFEICIIHSNIPTKVKYDT